MGDASGIVGYNRRTSEEHQSYQSNVSLPPHETRHHQYRAIYIRSPISINIQLPLSILPYIVHHWTSYVFVFVRTCSTGGFNCKAPLLLNVCVRISLT